MDIVIGGNHGKGKFREVVKLVLYDEDGHLAVEQAKCPICEIGKIYCKKDNYEVLQKTIAPSLNKSLNCIKAKGSMKAFSLVETGKPYFTFKDDRRNPED